jgi:hypothetical protein
MGRPTLVEGGDPIFQRRYPLISNAFKRLPPVQEKYESSRAPAVLLTDHWATSTTHYLPRPEATTEGVDDSERSAGKNSSRYVCSDDYI